MIKSKYIKSIGFEIECVFKHSDQAAVFELCDRNGWDRNESDVSTHTTRVFDCKREIKCFYKIEDLPAAVPEFKKLFKLVHSGKKFNSGGHIHVAFKEYPIYFKIASWDFVKFFQDEYKKFAKNEEEKCRINSHFAQDYKSKQDFIYQTNQQLNVRDGAKNNRFFIVNFNSFPAKGYETIEFRVFCLSHAYKQLERNVKFLNKTINEFLKNSPELDVEIKLKTPVKTGKLKIVKNLGFSGAKSEGVQNV